MRNFLFGCITETDAKDGYICHNVRPLVLENKKLVLDAAYFIDKSCKDVVCGPAIMEVLKTIKSKSGKYVHYLKPAELPQSCTYLPMTEALRGKTVMPREQFFELCTLGVSGLISEDSSFWKDLFVQVYRKCVNGKNAAISAQQWSEVRNRCQAWFMAQVNAKFSPGEDLTEQLTSDLQQIPGYPHYELMAVGTTLATGDKVNVKDPTGRIFLVEAIPLLNGKTGTCYNATAEIRVGGNTVYYITKPKPGVQGLSKRVGCTPGSKTSSNAEESQNQK